MPFFRRANDDYHSPQNAPPSRDRQEAESPPERPVNIPQVNGTCPVPLYFIFA
jgi:hypothetical protein